MLSLTALLIGMLDRTTSDYSESVTYNCFSSTITDTGYVNKTDFLRCIDEQNIRSDQISNAFLVLSITFASVSTIIYLGSHFQSNKKSKDTSKK